MITFESYLKLVNALAQEMLLYCLRKPIYLPK
jgi:hypothetical protein